MTNVKASSIASFIFFLITFLVFIGVTWIPLWVKMDTGVENATYQGLWLVCDENWPDTECERLEDLSVEMKVTRITMCSALALYIIALVLYSVWMGQSKKYLQRNGAGSVGAAALTISLIAALSNVVAVIVYSLEFKDMEDDIWIYWPCFYGAIYCVVETTLNSAITLGVTTCGYENTNVTSTPPPELAQHTAGAFSSTPTILYSADSDKNKFFGDNYYPPPQVYRQQQKPPHMQHVNHGYHHHDYPMVHIPTVAIPPPKYNDVNVLDSSHL